MIIFAIFCEVDWLLIKYFMYKLVAKSYWNLYTNKENCLPIVQFVSRLLQPTQCDGIRVLSTTPTHLKLFMRFTHILLRQLMLNREPLKICKIFHLNITARHVKYIKDSNHTNATICVCNLWQEYKASPKSVSATRG